MSKQLGHSADCGGTEMNNDFVVKECEGAQHMDLVHLTDTIMGSRVSEHYVENLHINMEIGVVCS